MSPSVPQRIVRIGVLLGVVAIVGAAPSEASAASGPIVTVSVATKAGALIGPVRVRAAKARVKVGGRRCVVAAGTPLAALIALRAKVGASAVGALHLVDGGHCGAKAASSSRLALTGIGIDRASGGDHWAYAVGSKVGTEHAADPAGAFGHGPIKDHAEVAWRWCTSGGSGACGDALDVLGLFADDTVAGDASSGVTITVTVKLRQGATAALAGKLGEPPAGTEVIVITPAGQRIDGSTTSGGGVFKLHASEIPPSGSRIIATGPAGVSPVGRLWP